MACSSSGRARHLRPFHRASSYDLSIRRLFTTYDGEADPFGSLHARLHIQLLGFTVVVLSSANSTSIAVAQTGLIDSHLSLNRLRSTDPSHCIRSHSSVLASPSESMFLLCSSPMSIPRLFEHPCGVIYVRRLTPTFPRALFGVTSSYTVLSSSQLLATTGRPTRPLTDASTYPVKPILRLVASRSLE